MSWQVKLNNFCPDGGGIMRRGFAGVGTVKSLRHIDLIQNSIKVKMKVVKTVETEFDAAAMYQLVADIEAYPNFLPWCPRVDIITADPKQHTVTATVYVSYLMLKQNFTTKNTYTENREITMNLVKGPFKHLSGHWRFTDLGGRGSQIDFTLDYEFANFLLAQAVGPVFKVIAATMVDAFIGEARKKYV